MPRWHLDTLGSSQGSRFEVRWRVALLRRMTFVTSAFKCFHNREGSCCLRFFSNPLPKWILQPSQSIYVLTKLSGPSVDRTKPPIFNGRFINRRHLVQRDISWPRVVFLLYISHARILSLCHSELKMQGYSLFWVPQGKKVRDKVLVGSGSCFKPQTIKYTNFSWISYPKVYLYKISLVIINKTKQSYTQLDSRKQVIAF